MLFLAIIFNMHKWSIIFAVGVYYNGYRVFDLVDNIYMDHDIHLADHPFKLPE